MVERAWRKDARSVDGFVAFNVTGGFILGSTSLTGVTGSTASLNGVGHGGNVTLAGAWGSLDYVGCYHTGGSLTVTATGPVNVLSANQQQGTWTPLVTINGSTTGITQSASIGYYQLVGRAMMVSFAITLTSKGAGAGFVAISGLPKPELGTAAMGGAALTHYINCLGLVGPIVGNIAAGGSTINLYESAATDLVPIDDTKITDTTIFKGTFFYFVR